MSQQGTQLWVDRATHPLMSDAGNWRGPDAPPQPAKPPSACKWSLSSVCSSAKWGCW